MKKFYDEKNGWTRITHRLARGPMLKLLGPYGVQMLLLVVDETLGWNREWVIITHRQFAQRLGWSNGTVTRYLKYLQGRGNSPFSPDNAPLKSEAIGKPRGPVVKTTMIRYGPNMDFIEDGLEDVVEKASVEQPT